MTSPNNSKTNKQGSHVNLCVHTLTLWRTLFFFVVNGHVPSIRVHPGGGSLLLHQVSFFRMGVVSCAFFKSDLQISRYLEF